LLKTPIPQGITFKVDGDQLQAERESDEQAALHGLARALANSAILGVTDGFTKQMDVVALVTKRTCSQRRLSSRLVIRIRLSFLCRMASRPRLSA